MKQTTLTISLVLIVCFFDCHPLFSQFNRAGVKERVEDGKTSRHAQILIESEGKIQEGIDILNALINRCEAQAAYPKYYLGRDYSIRGLGYYKIANLDAAAQDFKRAISLFNQAGDKGNSSKRYAWYMLSSIYYKVKEQAKAMEAADSCVRAAVVYNGPFHSQTFDAYSLRSNLAGMYQMKEIALSDQRKMLEIAQHNVEHNFVFLTAAERNAYWESVRKEITNMFAFAHLLNERQSEFTDALYDEQLLAKGILLTTEATLQRVIASNADLTAAYKKIRSLKKKAADGNTPPGEASAATIEADRLERSLAENQSAMRAFADLLSIHTDAVKAKLDKGSIAVEFVDYRVGKDSTMYAALILSPAREHVCFLPLFEKKELEAVRSNTYEHLWHPIIQAAGVASLSRIYFAPTAQLYHMPIESARIGDGQYMCDRYGMYRLSSTRSLAAVSAVAQQTASDAAIYGGFIYDMNVDKMKQDAAKYPPKRAAPTQSAAGKGQIVGLEELKWTKSEAQAIAEIINKQNKPELHAELYIGERGTEASFKALDGKHTRIVHLATHGSYTEPGTALRDNADIALRQSVLYFSGAENKLMQERIPDDVEDGLLTAEEVAQLDLLGLEIAVLSACQTGLGLVGSDGIFGLQRGFKKAGAESLIMSLWEVDDRATSLLMKEFYRLWLSGQGMAKHKAFEEAKQIVRSKKENHWDKPEYWAAFVLIDAID